jgi:N-acetylglucosamine-6-phosphate deacetylase
MGLDKVFLMADSIMVTGFSDGEYKIGVNEIVVVNSDDNGDAKIKNKNVREKSTPHKHKL